MSLSLTRKELYELVWSQPMRTAAATLGFSDVAVAKACRKANIPVPVRGYWNKKQAGKPVVKLPLPPRFPGASDHVVMGGSSWSHAYGRDLLTDPLPTPPTFDEEMDHVVERVRRMVGNFSCPRSITKPHRLIASLLAQDEALRTSRYAWEQPQYETPIEKRRLRILNAIFTAGERLGCKPSMSTSKYAAKERDTGLTVGQQNVSFTLTTAGQAKRNAEGTSTKERLRLSVPSRSSRVPILKSWEDTDDCLVEDQLTDIVVHLLVSAETFHRENAVAGYEWHLKRRAELEEEARKRRETEEWEARELLARQAQQRIDRLLEQAANVDRANTMRRYADAVLRRAPELAISQTDLESWATWVRGEADRIDPIKNGAVVEAASALSEVSVV